MIISQRIRLAGMSVLGASLSIMTGCASLPEDLGRSSVDAMTSERGVESTPKQQADVSRALSALLESPVTAHSAAQIALLASPEVHATYARLGNGVADLYEASRISNPIFSVSLLDSSVVGEKDLLTLGLVQSITDLLTLRSRTRISQLEFAQLQADVAAQILDHAAHVQEKQVEYALAEQIARMRREIARSAELAYELARRYREAGNLPPRALAMEAATASEARIAELEAQSFAAEKRRDLASAMGISSGERWTVANLAAVDESVTYDLATLLNEAEHSRLDIVAAKAEVEAVGQRLGLEDWSRWVGSLEAGWEYERETDGARLRGPVVDWELPLFNQGRDRTLREQSALSAALEHLRQLRIDMENDIRLAIAAEANARQRIVEIREHLIPARTQSVERGQEEVNYMLLGIFELIALRQEQHQAYDAYVHAVADYWTARVRAAQAMGKTLVTDAMNGNFDIPKLFQPNRQGPHSGHNMSNMQMSSGDEPQRAAGQENEDDTSHEHSHHDGDHK